MPPALLEEVFALNEELDEIRELRESGAPAEEWRRSLERARQPIEAKRGEHEEQLAALSSRWDALVDAVAPDRSDAPCSRRCASVCSNETTSITCSRASSGNSAHRPIHSEDRESCPSESCS